jgi:hypothetical protein
LQHPAHPWIVIHQQDFLLHYQKFSLWPVRGREPSHRERWVAAKFTTTAGRPGIRSTRTLAAGPRRRLRSRAPSTSGEATSCKPMSCQPASMPPLARFSRYFAFPLRRGMPRQGNLLTILDKPVISASQIEAWLDQASSQSSGVWLSCNERRH